MLDWTLIEGKKVGDTLNVQYIYYATPTATPVNVRGTFTIVAKHRRNWELNNGHRYTRKQLLKFIINYNNNI